MSILFNQSRDHLSLGHEQSHHRQKKKCRIGKQISLVFNYHTQAAHSKRMNVMRAIIKRQDVQLCTKKRKKKLVDEKKKTFKSIVIVARGPTFIWPLRLVISFSCINKRTRARITIFNHINLQVSISSPHFSRFSKFKYFNCSEYGRCEHICVRIIYLLGE